MMSILVEEIHSKSWSSQEVSNPKFFHGTSKGAVQKFRAMAVGSMFVHSEFEEMSAYIKKMEKEKREHLLL